MADTSRWTARADRWLDRVRHFLDSVATRTVLTVLILVSVLPPQVWGGERDQIWVSFFLAVFGPEFLLRLALSLRRARQRRLRVGEVVLLLLDLLALVSFLPVALGTDLRFLRLARLLLLLGYWRDLVVDVLLLLSRRERRYQIFLVVILGVLLSLACAVLLVELGARHDFDADGSVSDKHTFVQILWWSFRQIQDPGNLVQTVEDPLMVVASLLLTFVGLLLFSFFIGIGTTVVEELVERSRSQPLGLHDHTVILGLPAYSEILLHELAEIYRKNLRPFRGAVLAPQKAPDVLADRRLRHFRYRRGDPTRPGELHLVNLRRAKRVIILGEESGEPDEAVISSILAARRLHPSVTIYPALEHERNFPAARAAGGEQTHLVGTGSMLGFYVAQAVAHPGVYRFYRHLLQSAGCEIYTYIYTAAERRALAKRGVGLHLESFHRLAREAHETTLLGVFTASDPERELEDEDLELLIHPLHRRQLDPDHPAFDGDGNLRPERIRGVIGIAWRFRDLLRLARRLLEPDLPRQLASLPGRPKPVAADVQNVPPTAVAGVASLRLRSDRREEPRCILILGAGPRVPRVVTELLGFFGQVQISILATPEEPIVSVGHDLRLMMERVHGDEVELIEDSLAEVRSTEQDPGTLRLACGDAGVLLMRADWTHGHLLEARGAVTLEEADVILLLPSRTAAERAGQGDASDGRIALECLHLANLERSGAVRFRDGLHVLALVRDPAKGELLEDRLEEMVAPSREDGDTSERQCRYTVISRELAVQRYLMQNVFVRGLNSIYLDLLSSRGDYLSRLLPEDAAGHHPSGTFDPQQLADHLLDERDLLLVGYERRAGLVEQDDPFDDEPDVVIDPEELRAGRCIPWADVTALYVLGAHSRS